MLYQLSYFRISSYLSGHLLRWTSYRQSVIYSSKLPSSSLVRLESDRPYTPVFSFLFCDDFVILRIVGRSFTEVNSLPPHSTSLSSQKINFKTFVGEDGFKMDSNHRRYKPADLQSAPFGHSGILPFFRFFRAVPLSDFSSSLLTTSRLLRCSPLVLLGLIPK